ncbi:MAG TPA: hypothetical protein VGM88_03820 [Kofleriaceae bacterium]
MDALIILQRPKRNDGGDIFQYTSYVAGAKLVKLSPPTADGTLTPICCDQGGADFSAIDIQAYDISFDAKQIVFSGKLDANSTYGLFLLTLADGTITQIHTDPGRDYVSPIFLPGDKIMFTTNTVVEQGAPQHRDEYERGETIQLGRINIDGSNEEEGPRNLSHRTAPSLVSDGRVIFTQWDHLGPENQGDLMFVTQDMEELREGFGKEGTAASNSTLKAREISPGRYIGIGTARNRTLNAGALIDIRLGTVTDDDGIVSAADSQSEAHATYVNLTPDVPLDNEPSSDTIGRYYDAFPLNAKEHPDLLVSWADGPVESSVLDAAGMSANFGVYLLDTSTNQRHPILDDPNMWDIFPRPLQTRTAPNIVQSANDPRLNGTTLVGSLNAYNSTLHDFAPGSIYGVRVMEGFSSEEGFPEMFGTTMFEGHANLGVARLAADGSWSATIPSNVPVHLQTIDQFGMSLFTEPVWFSGRPGEQRICGGCHEDRAKAVTLQPGAIDTFVTGATPMYGTTPRADRQSLDFSRDKIMGIAWDKTVQPIFDNKCVSCHNGTAGANNPSYTITDTLTGETGTWTFDLRGGPVTTGNANIDMALGSTFTASYFSMAGPDMEAVEKGHLMLSSDFKVYMNPENAAGSTALTLLNPVQQFPTQDASHRAFSTTPHMQGKGDDLTPDEFYALILAADMGLNFYARENNPHSDTY